VSVPDVPAGVLDQGGAWLAAADQLALLCAAWEGPGSGSLSGAVDSSRALPAGSALAHRHTTDPTAAAGSAVAVSASEEDPR
jgi:hypothetical protein